MVKLFNQKEPKVFSLISNKRIASIVAGSLICMGTLACGEDGVRDESDLSESDLEGQNSASVRRVYDSSVRYGLLESFSYGGLYEQPGLDNIHFAVPVEQTRLELSSLTNDCDSIANPSLFFEAASIPSRDIFRSVLKIADLSDAENRIDFCENFELEATIEDIVIERQCGTEAYIEIGRAQLEDSLSNEILVNYSESYSDIQGKASCNHRVKIDFE